MKTLLPQPLPAVRLETVPRRQPTTYLVPAVAAVLAAVLALAVLVRMDTGRIKRRVLALAALNRPETSGGVALQRRIIRLGHCLPVYGSSELSMFQPTRPDLFFRDHPAAGFHAVVIGQPGDRCLLMLQELAALGDGVRGRRLAIFLSPTWFVAASDRHGRDHLQRQFARDFSPVQTALLLLHPRLDPALKAIVAGRLVEHADVVAQSSPLLADALKIWGGPSVWLRAGHWLLTPLLACQAAVFRGQDLWRTARLAESVPAPPAPVSAPREGPLDWAGVVNNLDRELAQRGRATPYSFDLPDPTPSAPSADAGPPVRVQGDREFLRLLDASPEWADFDALLCAIRQTGARVLLVGQPFNGSYYDACQVGASARRRYYDRIRALAQARGVALSDFSGFEDDRSFFADRLHPSARAWIYYDQALDRFYHGQNRLAASDGDARNGR